MRARGVEEGEGAGGEVVADIEIGVGAEWFMGGEEALVASHSAWGNE